MENAYVATTKTKRLLRYQPVSKSHLSTHPELENIHWDDDVEYEPVFRLGNNFKESLEMMSTVEELTKKFPGLDCGSCGAPTCQTLAEDIVRGAATSNDCIYVLREHISSLSKEIDFLSKTANLTCGSDDDSSKLLHEYIHKLTTELAAFGVPEHQKKEEE